MLAQKLWAVSALVTQDTVCYKAKSASGCLDMELNAKILRKQGFISAKRYFLNAAGQDASLVALHC